jgi:hypothetical protein
MIERLIVALRALARPVDEQLARFPDVVVTIDELALDFADAHLLFAQCQQLELTRSQRDAVGDVDRLLDEMSGSERAKLPADDTLGMAPKWTAVQGAAERALQELGYAEGPQLPSEAPYVPGQSR